MKRSVWVIIMWLAAAGSNVIARNSDVWSQGELVLMNGVELKGDIGYNWKAGIVQYREGNKIRAYSAYQVKAFTYFDDHQNMVRKFSTFEYESKSGQLQPLFLEEVFMGFLSVYREVRSMHEPIKIKDLSVYNSDEELVKNLENFTYLVLIDDELINLNLFYRTMWPKLKRKYETELRRFAMRIQANSTSTLVRLMLINQYNQLAQPQSVEINASLPTGQ